MDKSKPIAAILAAVAIFAIAAMLILLLFWPGKTVLQLQDDAGSKSYIQFEAKEGTTFSVYFIHSVNKSVVEEGYFIKDTNIYLNTCLYSAFGAGVATEVEEGQTITYTENGEMLISGFNRKINGLSYIVGTVSDHVLKINGEEISLRDLCGRNSIVRFEVIRKSRFSLWNS